MRIKQLFAVCMVCSVSATALGVVITRDAVYASDRTLILENFNGAGDLSSAKARATFDSIGGGAAVFSYAANTGPEGTITFDTPDYDPAVYSSMRVRVAVNRDSQGTTPIQVYPYPIGPAGNVTGTISTGTTLKELSLDLSGTTASGRGVRLDAFNYTNDETPDQFTIDYIMMDQSRTIGYEFERDGDLNQTEGVNMSTYSVANGVLSGTASGGDAQINLKPVGSPAINSDIYSFVEIRMKGTAGNRVDFFWDTAAQAGGATRVEIESAPSADGAYHTYLLDFTDEAGWTGNLTMLRLDPNTTDGAGFEVDSVRFMEAVPEPATLGLIALMGGGILFVRRLVA